MLILAQAQPALTSSFSWTNAVYTLALVAVAVGVIWWKLWRLRLEIHLLVTELPHMGSEFIRSELRDLREDLNETRAKVRVIEEKCGLNGQV